MSRIGKQQINIPQGVTVIIEHGVLTVKGPKGELARSYKDNFVEAKIDGTVLSFNPLKKSSIEARALWGTYVSHAKNMITGVTEGFTKKLEIEGVGYRASLQGENLVLSLGYSHPVEVKPKEGIRFGVEKNAILVTGADKEKVGEAAAYIRSLRKPEPYKGKGIRYEGEIIRRKAGKKAATTTGA